MENRKTLHFFTRPEKLLFGVCSALSQKLNLSSTVIRIAFIVFTLFFIPFGVVLYIGLYLTTRPKEKQENIIWASRSRVGSAFKLLFPVRYH